MPLNIADPLFLEPALGGFPEGLLDRAFYARLRPGFVKPISKPVLTGLKLKASAWVLRGYHQSTLKRAVR
jgi:hypothetical protein